jgi:hypothetical protein
MPHSITRLSAPLARAAAARTRHDRHSFAAFVHDSALLIVAVLALALAAQVAGMVFGWH